MDEKNTLKPPKDLNKQYYDTIRRNLSLLMECTGINQNHLVHLLEQRGMKANQGNISKFLSGDCGIQLSMLVSICEIYHVTFEQLLDEHYQYTPWNDDAEKTALPKLYSDDLLLHIPYLGDSFIFDPSDSHFIGYLQTYYVYFFPSQGDAEKVRTGTLKLMANGSVCEAVLSIKTNKIRNGQPYTKEYRGRCIISTAMQAIYILLTDQNTGELTMMNFRYRKRTYTPLQCRIVCTLINSTGEEHPPAVQRMFLSNTELKKEDLPYIIPHLYLNHGMIRIHQDQLNAFWAQADWCRSAIDELTLTNQPQSIYCLDEDDVLSTARRHLSKSDVHKFLSMMRSFSEHERIHKASRRADLLSHKLLRSLGYFQDTDN